MISTACRLPWSVSHSRHSRRPSSATGRPLERKRAQFSPCAPQTVTSKKLGLSSHSPVDWFLRRVLEAMRREQTDRPLAVERSSGSRVRLPVRTTRLMLVAAMEGSFRRRGARAELDDPVAQDAVRDLQVVVQLLEQVPRAAELQQVVLGLAVLADL